MDRSDWEILKFLTKNSYLGNPYLTRENSAVYIQPLPLHENLVDDSVSLYSHTTSHNTCYNTISEDVTSERGGTIVRMILFRLIQVTRDGPPEPVSLTYPHILEREHIKEIQGYHYTPSNPTLDMSASHYLLPSQFEMDRCDVWKMYRDKAIRQIFKLNELKLILIRDQKGFIYKSIHEFEATPGPDFIHLRNKGVQLMVDTHPELIHALK